MEGYTVTELMELTKKGKSAVRQAIHVAGIKPIIPEFIYPLETLGIILNAPSKGRPPKTEPAKHTDVTDDENAMIEKGLAKYRKNPTSVKPWKKIRRG